MKGVIRNAENCARAQAFADLSEVAPGYVLRSVSPNSSRQKSTIILIVLQSEDSWLELASCSIGRAYWKGSLIASLQMNGAGQCSNQIYELAWPLRAEMF